VTRVVTSFTSALPLIVDSDRLAILPRSFAKAHAEALGLTIRPLPLALPPIEISLVWYLGNERDAKHAWTRALVRDAVRSAGLTSSLP
jgi:DNA-binding transcriptional LysR family regulator